MNLSSESGSGSHSVNRKMRNARETLLELNRLGLPTAVEFRDTITPQFFADLLSWANVSARNEALNELVSGLSMPVGLRAPAHDVASLTRAIQTSRGEHHFLGVSAEGVCGIVKSTGNPDVVEVLAVEREHATSPSPAKVGGRLDKVEAALARLREEQQSSGAQMIELGPASLAESLPRLCQLVSGGMPGGSRLMGVQIRTQEGGSVNASALRALAAAVAKRRREGHSPSKARTSSGRSTETDNLRITAVHPLLPPACLLEELPRTDADARLIRASRTEIQQVLTGRSEKVVLLAGPAAVDSPSVALEYATRLAALAREVSDDVLIVMRVEIATPVTPMGASWPGLLFDPARDSSYQINRGIRQARELLLQVSALGMPTALEFRETITPQFFADLLSCAAVSAGSETLQELVSGLSMPVGLRAPKFDANDAEDLDSTLAAVAAANSSRSFLGVTSHGIAGIVESTGNADTALLLDGGRGSATQRALRVLAACASQPSVAVIAECAGGGPHGPGAVVAEQTAMAAAITAAIAAGEPSPRALAINSYLLSGATTGTAEEASRIRGLSTTEPCMDWLATEHCIRAVASAARERRKQMGGVAAAEVGKKRSRS